MKRNICLLPFAASLLLACTGTGAQTLDARRAAMRVAIDNAERGQFDAAASAGLRDHPLYGWLEYSALRRGIDTVDTPQALDFLKRYQGQAVAEAFRAAWLPALARRQDWPTLLANWRPSNDPGLQCAELNARLATGKADAVHPLVVGWKRTALESPSDQIGGYRNGAAAKNAPPGENGRPLALWDNIREQRVPSCGKDH